jgi:Pyruvate/2-oxoacid:ferredoxin oxidoreductase delta subunit
MTSCYFNNVTYAVILITGLFLFTSIPAEVSAQAADPAPKKVSFIDKKKCIHCGICFKKCPNKAVAKFGKGKKAIYVIDPAKCLGNGICQKKCLKKAISWASTTDTKVDSAAQFIQNPGNNPPAEYRLK